MKALKYILLCQIAVDDNLYNVGFKLPEFRSNILLDGQAVNIAELVERDQKVLDEMAKELKKSKPNLDKLDKLQTQTRLPLFLSGYLDSGQKTTLIFDLLSEKEYEKALQEKAWAEEEATAVEEVVVEEEEEETSEEEPDENPE